MKGIAKGSIFSLSLILFFTVITAFINMQLNITGSVLKGVLWITSGLCIFTGVLLVTKSATENKFLKGIGCALFTVLLILIITTIFEKHLTLTAGFGTYGLICILCGFLGTLVGINV